MRRKTDIWNLPNPELFFQFCKVDWLAGKFRPPQPARYGWKHELVEALRAAYIRGYTSRRAASLRDSRNS